MFKMLIKNLHINKIDQTGSVLIITIWIVLVLAGLVLVLSRSMRVEAIASANHVSSVQADQIARGAVEFVRARMDEEDETLMLEGETPYEAIKVGEGYFWLLRSNLDDDTAYYYGIRDEAARVNLNSASEDMLLKLPGMTSELAAAIIDWRDTDSEVTPSGAESEYYLLLDEPYYCKDSELETIEEVLLIKGASSEILFGEDTNRNGFLDPNENDADKSDPPDNADGNLDRGFFDYVTVYSVDENVSSDGERRMNINEANRRDMRELLQGVLSEDRLALVLNLINVRSSPFSNILDFYYFTGMTRDEFDKIVDSITTFQKETVAGLININTAPGEVLLCLPELVEADVDAILDKRSSDDADTSTIAWVLDVLSKEKAIAVGNYITTRSSRYSADIISASGDGRAYKRYRCVIDMQDEEFKTIYWKSLTHLGWPLDSEIISTLRSGEPLEEV